MKTILQDKVRIHKSTTTWFTNLFPCLKLWKFLQQKQRWTRNRKNWRKFRRGTWQKSEARKRWSMKQGRRAQKCILHRWDTLFNKIYDKIKHITHLVQNQRKRFRMWATSNCVNCSKRNPKRSAQHAYHIWNMGILYCTCGHFLKKRNCGPPKILNFRWTFFQSLSMSSRKEELMDTDTGKSQETNNIIWLTNYRRNAKRDSSKEFMTDSYEIMNSVSEWLKSSRWRSWTTWDALADEDHTHHFTEQEYFYNKNKMVASFQRARFQYHATEKSFWFQASAVYLATITTRSRRRTTRAYLLLQAQTMADGTEFIFYMVELARFLVVFLEFRKSRKRWAKSWVNVETCYF